MCVQRPIEEVPIGSKAKQSPYFIVSEKSKGWSPPPLCPLSHGPGRLCEEEQKAARDERWKGPHSEPEEQDTDMVIERCFSDGLAQDSLHCRNEVSMAG